MALAAMEGKPFGVLDPGPCCRVYLGQYCATNIVDDVNNAGLLLVLPKQVKGVNRVEANEVHWTEALISAQFKNGLGTSQRSGPKHDLGSVQYTLFRSQRSVMG